MRTAKIEIDGREHLLCFSARAVRACTERYGGMEMIGDALTEGGPVKTLDEAVWLIATLMDAGDRYAKLNGIDNPPPLSADDMMDVCDLADFAAFKDKIAETITNGRAATVEAEPPKNAGAAPGQPSE